MQLSRLGRSARRRREEPGSEIRDHLAQIPVVGDECPLALGAISGREARQAIERSRAPEDDRSLAAIGQKAGENLSHRNQTGCLRVDQSGVHPVSRRHEAVLGESLWARHHR